MVPARLAALLLIAIMASGCAPAPTPTTSVRPVASTAHQATATAATAATSEPSCPPIPEFPLPEATPPPGVDDATRAAYEKRREYGLRRDLDWIRKVAADPRAVSDFGVPMLPEETADLFARGDRAEPVRGALNQYGHTDELGGMFIDNELGGVVVVLWTNDLDHRAAAIRALLPACHPVVFRQARWSEAELRRWQDIISADLAWMEQLRASAQGVGADIRANVVTIEISSANRLAPAAIIAHYDAPAGLIRVESDGTGAALLPWGTVKGRVLEAGRPVANPERFMLEYGAAGDAPGSCGGGDMGFGVGSNGTFEYPCQVGRRTIHVRVAGDADGEWHTVASVTVIVPANGVVIRDFRLPAGWDQGLEANAGG